MKGFEAEGGINYSWEHEVVARWRVKSLTRLGYKTENL